MIIVLVIVGLSLLILVHEFGHFLAAKISGVRVEEFGLGFPPRLFGKKIGETLYSINWLPLGGFVKIYGEDTAGESIFLKTTDNPSVLATLEILETTLNKNSRPQNKNADGYSSLSGFDNPEFAQPTPRSTTLPELRATERYGSARRNR